MAGQKIGFILDETLITFLDEVAQGNLSEYLNKLLREKRQEILRAKMISALQEETQDPEYLVDLADWDNTIGDGLDAIG